MKRLKLLVGEDDARARESLKALLEDEYAVETASDGIEVSRRLRESAFDAVLLDIRMPGKDGLSILSEMREQPHAPAVLVMTAYGNSEVAIEAMKLGAYDYLTKPLRFDELLIQLERALANRLQCFRLETYDPDLATQVELIGESIAMQKVYKLIGQVAATDSTVLILGESGTGKELVARAIHAHSSRLHGPMVAVNCGGIPETLLEAELFGYEKGAFTGATSRRKGKFEAADGGTIFLDEVGELSIAAQIKLLRVLQEKTINPLGSERTVTLDIRILAATNCDLEAALAKGRFREDLFYRLNVVTIPIPPLRDRREDIPALAGHLLSRLIIQRKRRPTTFTPEALEALKIQDWPGNVRELEHAIERALILCQGAPISRDLLMPASSIHSSDPFREVHLEPGMRELVNALERSLISRALAEASGNRTRAAEILKINRRLLYDKMREFDLE